MPTAIWALGKLQEDCQKGLESWNPDNFFGCTTELSRRSAAASFLPLERPWTPESEDFGALKLPKVTGVEPWSGLKTF